MHYLLIFRRHADIIRLVRRMLTMR